MAKRFTDTDKWKKPFIKSLSPVQKLFWFYITDDCDHAGIWQVDFEVAQLRVGEPISEQELIQAFGENIKIFDGGTKWFLPSFIEFQYGELNEKNRVHESVLKTLGKYNLLENKPLTSPLQGAKDKDKYKDKDKEDEKGVQGEKQSFRTMPQPGDVGDLPDVKIQKAIEALKIQTDQTVDTNTIVSMWDVFKIQNLTGTKYYADVGAVESHFLNWILKKKFERNGIGKTKQERTTDSLTRLAQRGAEALERIRAKSS